MNIVLIEDDLQKAGEVMGMLRLAAPDGNIELCRSYQSGLKCIERTSDIALVVLDMSLPTFDPLPEARHGRPRPLGGYDIMRKLRRSKKSPSVVVLTALENFGSGSQQFSLEQLRIKCNEEFPEMFRGAIYYSQSRTAWRDELSRVLKDVL